MLSRSPAIVPLLSLLAGSCGGSAAHPVSPWPTGPTPPVAAQHPHPVVAAGGTRNDEYYWLRDDTRKKPEVLGYLQAEEDYAQAMLAPGAELRERLYQEMRGRIEEDDTSVATFDDGFWYYDREVAGKEYAIHCRRAGDMTAPEQVILDENQAATGHAYYAVGAVEVAPGGHLLAYAEDTVGRFTYAVRVVDLDTGTTLPDRIEGVEDTLAWAGDGRTFIYVKKDPVTLLGHLVMKHVVGADPASDVLVRDETDHSFYTAVNASKSKKYLFIAHSSTVSTEVWYADAADPALAFKVLLPRERDHEYEVDHVGDRFVIRTNWQAKNFRIVDAPVADAGDRSKWRDVIPARDDAFVHDFEPFDDFIAVAERSGGLRKVRIHFWAGDRPDQVLGADEPAYTAGLSQVTDMTGHKVRYGYTSLTTPYSTYEVDVTTGERTLLKRQPVRGGYDPADYVTERVEATARDGTKVPISLVYRRGLRRDGSAPLLIYGYGSYGISMDPSFRSNRLSLLDRGFVYAIAHIRGGQELGRRWYEDGKLLHKQNTFSDFEDATAFLVAQGYAARDKVFAMGGSAGGLLMGAIANQRPDLYRGIIAEVPFVDVVTTMLDDSIPLTTNEYDEWGDPRKPEYYRYMLSYAPYDNVKAQDYPAMLVVTALSDSQVQYYEPAKWVARLRRLKTDHNPLLFHVQMAGSHGGSSGRFEQLRDIALADAFILQVLGQLR